MRPLDAPARGNDGLPVLAEIDGDAVGAEELRDTLDRGVERVGERQPRDRLADHGQQRAAPLELEPGLAGALRRTEGVRGANGEARELGAAVIVGRAARREPELERAERRLAELHGDGVSLAALAALRERPLLLDGQPRGGLQLGVRLDLTVSSFDLERPGTHAPDERRFRSGGERCQAGDTPCRALVVRDGGERVAGDVQGAGALPARREPVVAEVGRECGQIGRERRDEHRLVGERPTATNELQHPRRRVAVERNVEHTDLALDARADERGGCLHRLGPPPLELRGQGTGRRPDRARDQRAGAVRKPDGRNLRAGAVRGCLDELAEERLERAAAGQRPGRPRERGQRLRHVGARLDREH